MQKHHYELGNKTFNYLVQLFVITFKILLYKTKTHIGVCPIFFLVYQDWNLYSKQSKCVQSDVILHKHHFAAKLTRRVTNTYYRTPLVICKIDMKENICLCVITTFFKTNPSSINKPTSLNGNSSRRNTCNETCKNFAKRNKILKCLDQLYF